MVLSPIIARHRFLWHNEGFEVLKAQVLLTSE